MISTAPDATTTPSASIGRPRDEVGHLRLELLAAQNRWLSPANTIPAPSSQRAYVLMPPSCAPGPELRSP
jgi:hypothetical protein